MSERPLYEDKGVSYICAYVEPELKAELLALAEADERTLSGVLRLAGRSYVQQRKQELGPLPLAAA